MRLGLPATLLVAIVAGGCGRIGYAELSAVGAAGTGPVGAGGAAGTGGPAGVGGSVSGRGGDAPATGTAGASGTGGAGASGTGGTIGMAGAGAGGTGTGGAGGGAGGIGGFAGAACPGATFGGHDYAFCVGPLSWTDAATDCGAKGMRLVRIDDATEGGWVQMTAFAGITSTSSTYWSWIGGSDQAVSGEWRWSDGAMFWLGGSNGAAQGGLYANWVAGSPTNTGAATDCAILQHGGFWTDFDCTRLERYVCEQY